VYLSAKDEEGFAVYNELRGTALLPQVRNAWIDSLGAESGAGAKSIYEQVSSA
jgi:hypothetical protein